MKGSALRSAAQRTIHLGALSLADYAKAGATPFQLTRDYLALVQMQSDNCVTATARKLAMHRRTIQRMNAKRTPRARSVLVRP